MMHSKKTPTTATITVLPQVTTESRSQGQPCESEPLELHAPRNRHELRRNRAIARKAVFVLAPAPKRKRSRKGRK